MEFLTKDYNLLESQNLGLEGSWGQLWKTLQKIKVLLTLNKVMKVLYFIVQYNIATGLQYNECHVGAPWSDTGTGNKT